ncbi:MAG: B-box zinc finger protein [Thermomicrobiales bacterium]
MATVHEFPSSSGEVPCTYHPNVQTRLRCSRCGKPICPRCGVRTPVGLRCPECAGVRGLPTYRTDSAVLLKASAIGLAVAIAVGALWAYAPDWGFYLSLLLGFGVAEAMAWASKAKRGLDLQLIGMAMVAVGLVLSRVLLAQRFGISAEQVNALSDQVFTPAILEEFGRPVSVAQALHIRFSPDGIFAALSFAIIWIRFR